MKIGDGRSIVGLGVRLLADCEDDGGWVSDVETRFWTQEWK